MFENFVILTQKSAQVISLYGISCDWDNVTWSSSISSAKSLVLWKLLYCRLPTNIEFKKRPMISCSICSLCNSEESISHLFFKCPDALSIWFFFKKFCSKLIDLSFDSILSFSKFSRSPLIKLIRFVAITFSVWMIWRRKNYSRFQQGINTPMTINCIKKLCQNVR